MKRAAYIAVLALIWGAALVVMGLAARVMWYLLQLGWGVL